MLEKAGFPEESRSLSNRMSLSYRGWFPIVGLGCKPLCKFQWVHIISFRIYYWSKSNFLSSLIFRNSVAFGALSYASDKNLMQIGSREERGIDQWKVWMRMWMGGFRYGWIQVPKQHFQGSVSSLLHLSPLFSIRASSHLWSCMPPHSQQPQQKEGSLFSMVSPKSIPKGHR